MSLCRAALFAFCLPVVALAKEPDLPAAVDLAPRFERLGLGVRAQGDRNTCSLFAIAALADFELAWESRSSSPRLSEEFLCWAANESTGLRGDQAMFYEALHGLNSLGVCSRDLMQYDFKPDGKRSPSPEALADANKRSGRWRVEWIKRWDLDLPLTDEQMAAIKSALASGHPVACGLRWPHDEKTLVGVPNPKEVFDGHSIVFVGYFDDPRQPGGGSFSFRNSFGDKWGRQGYGTMSYAYVRAYANDALWLRLGPEGSEVPVERFEAESLKVVSSDKCATSVQAMNGWAEKMWSGGQQLFCRAEQGGSVELAFTLQEAARCRLRLLGTTAPDYGTISVELDGQPAGNSFDLYSGRVSPAGSLELGTHDLAAGSHSIRVTAKDKHPASKGYAFGLDALERLAVSD